MYFYKFHILLYIYGVYYSDSQITTDESFDD